MTTPTQTQPSPLDVLIAQLLLTHPALAQWMQNRRDAYLNSIAGTRIAQLVNVLRGAQQTALRTGKPADPAKIEQQLNAVLAGPKIAVQAHGSNASQAVYGTAHVPHEDQAHHGAGGGPAQSSASNVGQTEVSAAVAGAAHHAYREAGVAEHEWVTAQDAKVCPICAANEAAGPVVLGMPFPSGDLTPPGHPRCRCAAMPADAASVPEYVEQQEQQPLRWYGWPATSLEEEARLQNKGWDDAWLHELRGGHGEWVRTAGGGFPEHLPAGVPLAGRTLASKPIPRVHTHISVSQPATVMPPALDTTAKQAAAIKEAEHATAIQDKYVPGVEARTRIVFANEPSEVEADTAVGVIHVSPAVTKAGNGTKAAEMLSDAHNRHWFVPTAPEYSAADVAIAHETGHALIDHMRPEDTYSPELWTGLAKTLHAPFRSSERPAAGEPFDYNGIGTWLGRNHDPIADQVSGYAATSPDELAAELWAEYTLNPTPRPPAAFWGKFIMSHRTPAMEQP